MTPTRECWIHSLPAELVAQILVAVVAFDSNWVLDGFETRPTTHCPTAIQLVCQRWRLIVCSTPAFWTFLEIGEARDKNYRLYLERSRTMPIKIQLQVIPATFGFRGEKVAVRAAQRRDRHVDLTLAEHAHRIWELDISGLQSSATYTCLESLPNVFINLRKVSICTEGACSSKTFKVLAPRLRSFRTVACWIGWEDMPIAADLETLSVTLTKPTRIPLQQIVDGLRGYPNLRELDLCNFLLEEPDISLQGPVVLEKLDLLNLTHFSTKELEQLLDLLSTPRLKALRLKERTGATPSEPIRVSPLRVPVLEMLVPQLEPRCVLEMAKQFPFVTCLHVSGRNTVQGGSNTMFDSLASYWRALPHPLPLETLKTSGIRLSTILSLLEGDRDRVLPALRKVSVHYRDIFLLRSEQHFKVRAEEQNRLETIVELDVHGLPEEVLAARLLVGSWEQECIWEQRFKIRRLWSSGRRIPLVEKIRAGLLDET